MAVRAGIRPTIDGPLFKFRLSKNRRENDMSKPPDCYYHLRSYITWSSAIEEASIGLEHAVASVSSPSHRRLTVCSFRIISFGPPLHTLGAFYQIMQRGTLSLPSVSCWDSPMLSRLPMPLACLFS